MERTMSRRTFQLGTNVRRLFLGILTLCFTTPVWGQAPRVISVEEHWELKLGNPDADRSAPQTTMVVSPSGNVDGVHFLFTLNHATVPQYEPGGMQVQLWDGEQLVSSSSSPGGAFIYESETVRWVQRVSLEDQTLKFQILNGESETWGSFGGDDLTVSEPTTIASLNGYRPAVSLTESQVNYAENRVVSLTLMKLVWVTEDGQVHELNAPIALDTSLDE
jgi:hypothetical protein